MTTIIVAAIIVHCDPCTFPTAILIETLKKHFKGTICIAFYCH